MPIPNVAAAPSRRAARDLVRGRHAAGRTRASGGSALQAAFAHIDATFAGPARHAFLKDRVSVLIRCGSGHAEVWTRYRRLAERHPAATLDSAIGIVDRLHSAEIAARKAATESWGCCGRPRLVLVILEELRLILRVVRRHAPLRFPEFLTAILTATPTRRSSITGILSDKAS